MAIIKEDYCSKELSLLLDKKGFDGYSTPHSKLILSELIPHSVAMKWLREVHNLFIEITVGESEGKTWYDYDILPINGKFIYWKALDVLPPVIECNTFEKACETAIKYCLENLI